MRPSKETLYRLIFHMKGQPQYFALLVSAAVGYVSISAIKEIKARYDNRLKEKPGSSRNRRKTERQSAPASVKPEWSKVLGVSPSSSLEEIKIAYRKKIFEYHPDRVTSLVQECKDIAEQKSKLINEAYQIAIRLKRREIHSALSTQNWPPRQSPVSGTPRSARRTEVKKAKMKMQVP